MKRIFILFIIFFLVWTIPSKAAVKKDNRLWQDETIYSLMVDRFNDGDTSNDYDMNRNDLLAYNGGDIQGIIDRLDYLKDMGFTAIRLSPIFESTGYDGYQVTDYYKVNKHFGSLKTFQQLVKQAHARKMKVLVDFVTNNAALNKTSENTYLLDAAKWWVKKTGIDGYSLPEANLLPISFWKDFSKEIKEEKHDFFLMGIPKAGTSIDSNQFHAAGIDCIFDDTYSKTLRSAFATTDQSFSGIKANLDKRKDDMSAVYVDNENTTRFTKDIVDKRQFPGSRWSTALAFIYTTPGIPVVYYGTEIALNGGKTPDNRREMNFRANKDLIDYITKLGELRNKLPSLTRGSMEMLVDKGGLAVYKRVYKGETAIIAINNTRKSQYITLTNSQIEGGKELRGLLEGDLVRSKQNKYDIIIDRDKSEVYVLAKKSGINITLIGLLVIVWILAFFFIWKLKKR
jgi:glycosidase